MVLLCIFILVGAQQVLHASGQRAIAESNCDGGSSGSVQGWVMRRPDMIMLMQH